MSNENELLESDYIEDPYFHPNEIFTPSLDELEEIDSEYEILDNELDLFDLRQLEFDDFPSSTFNSDDSVSIETEFFTVKMKKANDIIRAFFNKRLKKQVRVTYCDLTKPYLAKLPKDNSFRKYLDISVADKETAMAAVDHAPDLSHLSEEERRNKKLHGKMILAAKLRKSAELKRNLGITVWKEVSDDINQGIKNVKESNVYQTVETKVGQVTKAVTEAPIYQKTTSLFGGITSNISNKLGQMKQSDSFRSIEERVGSAYENVKTKVVSRSNSQQSLSEEVARSRSGSVVTSPTIPEEKPLM
ncbi:hypothetical protein WA026_010570 [Henosepilachna vigintioctopunctata]|uniref:Tumor protein D54 n=1 Tax=Henosepilachna vigintioctopunctata TaxID=420089 RepID=A0AAW1VEL0_9CUCU